MYTINSTVKLGETKKILVSNACPEMWNIYFPKMWTIFLHISFICHFLPPTNQIFNSFKIFRVIPYILSCCEHSVYTIIIIRVLLYSLFLITLVFSYECNFKRLKFQMMLHKRYNLILICYIRHIEAGKIPYRHKSFIFEIQVYVLFDTKMNNTI